MSRGIRLSDKHGVNPSVGLCFYCRKSMDVVLFGHLPEDQEAPQECIHTMEPCDECKERMKIGVFFIEVRPGKELGEQEPTGRLVVLKDEAVKRLIASPELLEQTPKRRVCYMEPATFEKVFGEHMKEISEKETGA